MAREPLKVLTESMFYVLLSLRGRSGAARRLSGMWMTPPPVGSPLGPGTLYTILAKFQEEGWSGRRRGGAEADLRHHDRGRACSGRSSPALRLCVADGDAGGAGVGAAAARG